MSPWCRSAVGGVALGQQLDEVGLGGLPPEVACLGPGGLLAFTVETHDGEGVVLGAGLRYAHSIACVRSALAACGLTLLSLEAVSARTEAGAPVPGLVAVAIRPHG